MRAGVAFCLLLVVFATAQAAEPGTATPPVLPKRIHFAAPVFPPEAITQNLAGQVTVHFTIDERGNVSDARVVSATPPGVFDTAALEAVKRWVFEPVRVDGKAVAVPVTEVIRFPQPQPPAPASGGAPPAGAPVSGNGPPPGPQRLEP